MLLKIVFPLVFLGGLWLLIRSIGRIIHIYGGRKTEVPLSRLQSRITLTEPGPYEIAYRRRALLGVIPTGIGFSLVPASGHPSIPVTDVVNHLGSRKDMSGSRIIPIAEFEISEPGQFDFSFPDVVNQKEGDMLIITKKTGAQGFVMIFAILVAAIATIAGLVLSVLAFLGKL